MSLKTCFGTLLLGVFLAVPVNAALLINELDSDSVNTPSTDFAEFVELYDTSGTSVPLDGYSLLYVNGNGDVTYFAVDLDGRSTSALGYFTVGSIPTADIQANNPANPPGELGNLLQNGADAVVLYQGDASAFPNGTGIASIVPANIVDAVVYDTADADDAGLLTLLVAGGQVNEFGRDGTAATGALDSIGRLPNGSGAGRDTTTWTFMTPTPGGPNGVVIPEPATISLALMFAAACCVGRRRRR
jgi:hypothetical protein